MPSLSAIRVALRHLTILGALEILERAQIDKLIGLDGI